MAERPPGRTGGRQRAVLEPCLLGPVPLRNRLIRAATAESMVVGDGCPDDAYVGLHEDLARGGVGLAFTGHIFCHPRGRYGGVQPGLHTDGNIGPFRAVTQAVHRHGGKIFAQLAHAGSQSMSLESQPLAPSAVANVMTGRPVQAANESEIEEAVAAFAVAARRAVEAGFDGVQLHGANGYLISQFRSPLTNQRTDHWGGSQENRDRFALEVIKAIREQLPHDVGFTMKVGLQDLVDAPGGLGLDDSISSALRFIDAGLDGVEVSSNLMSDYVSASIRPYVAVGRRRALQDWMVYRLHRSAEPEAYFLPLARALRERTSTNIILAGGLRRLETMQSIVDEGAADFVSLGRPLVREPALVRQLMDGKQTSAACVSCNICLIRAKDHPLQCWRVPRKRLFQNLAYRLRGVFMDSGGS